MAANVFPRNVRFDVTSCQFAIHYAFATEATARTMMRNATALLAPGGVFLGTMPNADYLVSVSRVRAASTHVYRTAKAGFWSEALWSTDAG